MQAEVEQSEFVVVGGGLAGVCAAIAAARLGARVSLINNRPVLGGNSSSEIRVWIVGATAHGTQRYSRETGIMGELFVENQYRNPEGNPYLWDQVVLDAVRAEPNITLHLNTVVHEIETDDSGRITSVSGWGMLNETWTKFEAPVFADCTGDGLIGALAGATTMVGREGRNDFSEQWAPLESDGAFLGSSMFFYTKDAGEPVKFIPPNITKDISTTPIPRNRIIRTGDNGCSYWWIEWGGQLDIVKDADRIHDELLGVIYGIWDYIKNSGEFDADNLTLEWVGSIPGRREYRRLLGDHVITQNDLMNQVRFDDAVAYGGWSIDLHPVEGMYAEDPAARQRYANGPYQIPFRSLYSHDIPNLLMAGRDISASHIAEGSMRVMATCAIEGEAIGTAAALMAESGEDNRSLGAHAHTLQQTLLRQDAALIGVELDDPDDVLRDAVASASSCQRVLDTPNDNSGAFALTTDIGIVLPVDPRLDTIDLLLDATDAADLTVEVWETGRPQNYVPVELVSSRTVPVPQGEQQWISVDLGYSPDQPGNVVIVLRAQPAISLSLSTQLPYGVMMLRRKTAQDAQFEPLIPDEPDDLLTTWVARGDRGHAPVLRVRPETGAYLPSKVTDCYQRPFGGPHMWSSRLASNGTPGDEWLRLDLPTPREIASIRVVFNDDVDIDLINLHHHRTPHPVMPTLSTDYLIEAHLPGHGPDEWTVLADVTKNRHRHAIHDVEPVVINALRIVTTKTGGAPYVSICAVKAHPTPSGRESRPWVG